MQASGVQDNKDMTGERKVALLLHAIGGDVQEIYTTMELLDADKKDWEVVLDHLDAYFKPKENETVNRHLFHTRKQKEGETIDMFVTDLKKLSKNCGFNELRDSLIRDRIVCGILNVKVRDKLLREAELDLVKCINICKASEIAEKQSKQLNEEIMEIHGVKKKQFNWKKGKDKCNLEETENKKISHSHCRACGYKHLTGRCPAYNNVYRNCRKTGHFEKMCYFKKGKINSIQEDNGDSDSSEMFIGSIERIVIQVNSINEWYQNVQIVNNEIKFKVDTGAEVNILNMETAKKLRTEIKDSNVKLKSYNGSSIKVAGQTTVNCKIKEKEHSIDFQIIDFNEPCIIGLPFINKFELLKKVETVVEANTSQLVNEYKTLFEGIGNIGKPYEIKVKPEVPPVVEAPRKIPISLQEGVKKELEKMEKLGIIRKVTEATEWCSSLVTVKKPDNSLRLCLDPQNLNKAIIREWYQLPTFQKLSSRMADAKVFSILDGNKGFYQIKLSKNSQLLTTFAAGHYGRYCYLRLPYGLCSAPEVFHRTFKEVFEGLPGVEVYIDDIIVWGKNKEEHNNRLKAVLERAYTAGVRFNKKKCKFCVNEVRYVGHVFTKDGLKLDQEKVSAILNLEEPKDKKQLQVLLGMVTYVSKFLPNFSKVTESMRQLLRNDTEFLWLDSQKRDFVKLKEMLTKAPVLKYYDVNKDVVVSVDASSQGLGAVLLQDNLPVAYASKALTSSQKMWAQIEKELLAIVHGCQKFHQYVYGKTITVETDHKPLENIFKKPLNDTPLRLQRLRLSLQPYDIVVKYKPGKDLLVADALSRNFVKNSEGLPEIDGQVDAHVCMLTKLQFSDSKLELFVKETSLDVDFMTIMNYVQYGWPNFEQIPNHLKFYYSIKDDLFTVNGLLYKNRHVVVPKSLRSQMLHLIHYNHLGLEKCKARAKSVLFWPHMLKELEDVIRDCSTCLKFQKSHPKESLLLRNVPSGPWEVIGIDIFYYKSEAYLLLVDYYSKLIELKKLSSENTSTIIVALKSNFARYGIPKIVYSDQGPQFCNFMFKTFASNWNFKHICSSPYYHRSNGMVERYVQTCKQMLKKADHSGRDPYIALIEYRNTPIDSQINRSPTELMFGRKVNAFLPTKENFDVKVKTSCQNVSRQLENRQRMYKYYHDKKNNCKPVIYAKDEVVYVKDPLHNMSQARILSEGTTPRSYKVQMPSGRVMDRNRFNIYKASSTENFQIDRDDIIDSCDKVDNPEKSFATEKETPNTNKSESLSDFTGLSTQVTYSRSGRIIKKPVQYSDYVLY